MSQQIHLGAIVFREDRLLVFRGEGADEWELPGGELRDDHEDVDVGMESLLADRGIATGELAEAFIETVYIPRDDGHTVYNLYSAGDWRGEPSPPPGHSESWVALAEISGLAMDERIRNALLVALGVREPVDDAAQIMESMKQQFGDVAVGASSSEPGGLSAAGLDVLRTLHAEDPVTSVERLRARYGDLGRDIVDFAMGDVWADETLDRRTQNLMVVSMMAALGRGGALRTHLEGALNHGATPGELVQVIRTVAVYAGFPAAAEAQLILNEVFTARGIVRPESSR